MYIHSDLVGCTAACGDDDNDRATIRAVYMRHTGSTHFTYPMALLLGEDGKLFEVGLEGLKIVTS